MSSIEQTLAILCLLVVLVLIGVVPGIVQRYRRRLTLRTPAALDALRGYAAESIEEGRPLHAGFAQTTPYDAGTVRTLAHAELPYQTLSQVSAGAEKPVLTTSDVVTLAVAQDSVRRAMMDRHRPELIDSRAVIWLPAGPAGLAYAAGLTAVSPVMRLHTSLIGGQMGAEMSLVADAAQQHRTAVVAASDDLAGQAAAFASADHLLLGEEAYLAQCFAADRPSLFALIVVQDLLRYGLIAVILIAVFLRILG
jgi:hypothetical protein